jgi:uncharacterized protein YndB with AHSA1/START domain
MTKEFPQKKGADLPRGRDFLAGVPGFPGHISTSVMSAKTSVPGNPFMQGDVSDDREIFSSRVIAAPCEAVFAACVDPARLALWWGPDGFSNTFEEFDLRPGGHWRFVMHGPDGKNYKNHSVFREIAAPERIVFDHVCAPEFEMTIGLEARGETTRFSFRMRFASAAVCAAVKSYVVPANEQNFDRLTAVLREA